MADNSVGGRSFYKYIVIGCGGIGSAALYWLSKQHGADILGLEQFELGHSNGGSQDHSRIIRMAYHDDVYTNLTPDTYTAWEQIEKESGVQVVYRTGGILLAKKGETDSIATKYADAMAAKNIPFEWLTGSELRQKFPQFHTDNSYVAVYQKDGGLVDAAMANALHIQLAQRNGATVIEKCPVIRIQRNKNGILSVVTTKGTFTCQKVVVTAGAWINHVVGSIGVHVPIYVTQEQVTYFGTPNMKDFTKDKFPIFIYHSNKTDIYGMPLHGNTGFKIGVDAGGHLVTADTRTFAPDPVREQRCLNFMRECLPKSVGPILYSKTCLYTMPPDRNFIIDNCRDYGYSDVIVCNGAGHAYKSINSIVNDKGITVPKWPSCFEGFVTENTDIDMSELKYWEISAPSFTKDPDTKIKHDFSGIMGLFWLSLLPYVTANPGEITLKEDIKGSLLGLDPNTSEIVIIVFVIISFLLIVSLLIMVCCLCFKRRCVEYDAVVGEAKTC